MIRMVPVHDALIQRDLPVLQSFLQGHMQCLAVLHLDGSALFVGQVRTDGAHERRGRLVAAGLAVLPGVIHQVEQLLLLGLELVQLDGKLAVLGQVDGRRTVERGERAVQRLDVALGQAHHLPHVLQLVAQRRDFLEVKRHDAVVTTSTAAAAACTHRLPVKADGYTVGRTSWAGACGEGRLALQARRAHRHRDQ